MESFNNLCVRHESKAKLALIVMLGLSVSACAAKRGANGSDLADKSAQRIVQSLNNPLDLSHKNLGDQDLSGKRSGWPLSSKKAKGQLMTLEDITRHTISNSPDIGIYGARAQDAKAGIKVARSSLLPTVDARVAAGVENSGTHKSIKRGQVRQEASVKVKQTVVDFGKNNAQVKRAKYLYSSSQLRLADKAEAVILEVAEAYLDVMEQSQYIANGRQNVKAHQKFYGLVKAAEGEGNGTQADVQRAFSRLENAKTQIIDFETARQKAIGRFRRISGLEPGRLRMPPSFWKQANLTRADIASILKENPKLQAIEMDSNSLRQQVKGQRTSFLPSVTLEGEANAKKNVSGKNDAAHDYRGMVVMRWNLFDGGRKFAVEDQILARLKENEFRYLKYYNEQEEDLIEAIRTMQTTRKKAKTINDQIKASEKVSVLYTQQFTVGKKRLLEVLDAQKDLFAVRRDRIANNFEKLRANYRALRLKGKLVETITGHSLKPRIKHKNRR